MTGRSGGVTITLRTKTPRLIGTTASQYPDVLAEYLRSRSEGALYRASLLSQLFVNEDLGPEDPLRAARWSDRLSRICQ